MARKIPGWVWLLGAAAGAWYLWKNSASAQGAAAAQALLPAPSAAPDLTTFALPGSSAATGAMVSQAASTWSALTPAPAIASGYINLPDGTQVAAATLTAGNTRTDAQGSTYVLWGGLVYKVGDMDAQGNWPVTLVGAAT
jgi:hypothetical protein